MSAWRCCVGIVSDWLGNLQATPPPDALPIPGVSYNGDGYAASVAAPGVATVPTGDTCPSGYGTIYAWDGSKQCLTDDQIVAAGPGIADQIAKGTAPSLQDRAIIQGADWAKKGCLALGLTNCDTMPTFTPKVWTWIIVALAIAGTVGGAYVYRSFK